MRFYFTLLTAFSLSVSAAFTQPLALLRQNPHYFQYQNKPFLIVGSGEHYGAIINLDFDYKTYLNTLHVDGLNTTRLFTGAYIEKLGDFGIRKNTLAPKVGRLILPWARSNEAGYALGGTKFDLSKWDDAYFARLRDFMTQAQRQGIIVEATLFSSYYGTGWPYSVFNPVNNVNQTDDIEPLQANTLQNGTLLRYQEAYVRKLVRELNAFPNLYFEIQNEPWADLKDTILTRNEYHILDNGKSDWRASLEVVSQKANEWQRRVASWIVNEETKLPNRHLISQNISNFRYPIVNPDSNVSVYTFHYALPEAVSDNYALNKVIGFNETGFAGQADATYRRQAWRFLMSGGGLFNHLDYSFAVGDENGQDLSYRGSGTPGGGSSALRKQFAILKQYIEKLDLARLQPDKSLVKASPGAITYTLKNGSADWVVYAEPLAVAPFSIQLTLPKGGYRAEWMDVLTGKVIKAEPLAPNGKLTAPSVQDLVVRIRKM